MNRLSPTFGCIAVGLPADVVLYERDPTQSLATLESTDTVIAEGRVYPRATLDVFIARYREHFRSVLYARVMALVARLVASDYDPHEAVRPNGQREFEEER